MPRNRTHKTADGRWSYKVTDKAGQTHTLKSRKNERETAFKKRCDRLDRLCDFELKTDTFDQLFASWQELHLEPNCSNGDQRVTVHLYDTFVKPRIGRYKLTDLTPPVIYQMLSDAAKLGWSRSTVSKVKGIVSRPFNWAVEAVGLNMQSPTASVRFRMQTIKKPSRRRYLTDSEVDRIMAAIDGSKYADCFRLMLLIGLRPSEALGLQIHDIQPDHVQIRRAITAHDTSDGKTDHAPRDIQLPPEAVSILTRLKTKMAFQTAEGWLFPSLSGQPNMDALESAFERALNKTAVHDRGQREKKLRLIEPAVKASMYSMRHTFATRMVSLGMPAVTLQKILGHSDIKTTLTYYVDVTDSMRDDAVNLMALASGPKSGPKNEDRTNSEQEKALETLERQGL